MLYLGFLYILDVVFIVSKSHNRSYQNKYTVQSEWHKDGIQCSACAMLNLRYRITCIPDASTGHQRFPDPHPHLQHPWYPEQPLLAGRRR